MSTHYKVQFDQKKLAQFYPELRRRVDEYFKTHQISKHANWAMVAKTTLFISLLVGSYVAVLSGYFQSAWVLISICAFIGFLVALIGMNVSHDALHGAYSSNKWVNKYLGMIFNFVGANDYVWKTKHNMVHHTYTNIHDHDDDITFPSIVRVDAHQKKKWIHRYQHYYVFLLYPLTTLSWVFMNDYQNFFRKNYGSYDNTIKPKVELVRLFGYKVLYLFMFIALPIMVLDLPWYATIIGFVVLHIFEGTTLALVFQMAHLVEPTQFPEPSHDGQLEHNWAVHQLKTTANFSTHSRIASFLCGGLNQQIEHHLFPKICHIHYRKIGPIVKQTAEEFQLPYYECKNFFTALQSHARLMKKLGRV